MEMAPSKKFNEWRSTMMILQDLKTTLKKILNLKHFRIKNSYITKFQIFVGLQTNIVGQMA